MIKVSLSPAITRFSAFGSELHLDIENINQLYEAILNKDANLASTIFSQDGCPSSFISIYLDNKEIDILQDIEVQVSSCIDIVSSIAGG